MAKVGTLFSLGKVMEPVLQTTLPSAVLSPEKMKDKGQRNVCGCMVSKDIGMYNTCSHFCVYCYVNTSKVLVQKNRSKHSDESESIFGDS